MAKKASALVAAARSKLKAEKGEAIRTGVAMGSAYVIGSIESKPDQLQKIPQILGLPRTFTLAVIAKGGAAMMGRGTGHDVLSGIGDAAAIIAVHSYGKGEAVNGFEISGPRKNKRAAAALRAKVKQLEDRLTRMSAGGGDDEDESIDDAISALEGLVGAD